MTHRYSALKIATLSSLGFALVFGAFSLMLYFGDWTRLGFVFFMGLFIGLMAAPEIEPKAFKRAWMIQVGSGMVSAVLLALAFQLDADLMLPMALLGGLLGWFAPLWLRHVPIP
jgi:uncharacterized membrane protein YjjP (DUF1212 family)